MAATDDRLRELVWAMAVPVLVADYRPVLQRHSDKTADEIVAALDDNQELLASVGLIPALAESRPWSKLYGQDGPEQVPSLADRLENPAAYPRLKADMIEQLTAPWHGVTSIVQEHGVPTSWGHEVLVRSHWNVRIIDGQPDWGHVVIVDLDVTDLRTAEHNLAQANRLEAIGAMAAGVAHELNTPLQFISDNLRFITDNMAEVGAVLTRAMKLAEADVDAELTSAVEAADLEFLMEEMPTAVHQSLGGVESMAKIVRALKDFSHPGTGQKEPVDLNDVVVNAVTVSRNEWKHVADIDLTLHDDMPMVKAIGSELRQVLLNLVVNAAHAIADQHSDGSKGRIHVATSVSGGFATIAIADDGGGVPESIRSRVFDPFFTTKDIGKGTGQGLALARRVVVGTHGGRLDLDVEDGVGSTFTVRIPLDG